jgi:short-subunit dehydrogenase
VRRGRGARAGAPLLDGATVLVTGASGGIGHAIARTLAAHGASLVLTGRRVERLEPLAAELGARVVPADLGDAGDLERLLDQAGPLDVLVANAALPGSGPLESYSEAEIDRALQVNLRAPIVLARRLAPAMVQRGRGHLVFISSLSGKVASSQATMYCATKFGLRGFSLSLRAELHGTGVGVSTVFPGFIRDAGMFHDSGTALPRGVGTRSPQDVARAVADAIERDRAEVDVAPMGLRIGALFGGLLPDLSTRVSRRAGGERIAADLARAQRHLR